mmetsp:Transcript_34859/g.68623  ORF Transcript_34859/g.68623 Transcript_34859/m.68623 type:complete len:292 (+) Transcript_34859:623-1498(+)
MRTVREPCHGERQQRDALGHDRSGRAAIRPLLGPAGELGVENSVLGGHTRQPQRVLSEVPRRGGAPAPCRGAAPTSVRRRFVVAAVYQPHPASAGPEPPMARAGHILRLLSLGRMLLRDFRLDAHLHVGDTPATPRQPLRHLLRSAPHDERCLLSRRRLPERRARPAAGDGRGRNGLGAPRASHAGDHRRGTGSRGRHLLLPDDPRGARRPGPRASALRGAHVRAPRRIGAGRRSAHGCLGRVQPVDGGGRERACGGHDRVRRVRDGGGCELLCWRRVRRGVRSVLGIANK